MCWGRVLCFEAIEQLLDEDVALRIRFVDGAVVVVFPEGLSHSVDGSCDRSLSGRGSSPLLQLRFDPPRRGRLCALLLIP